MKAHLILASLVLSVGSLAYSEGRDPSGEEAFYKLDKSSSRTSSMIKDGEATGTVADGKSTPDSYEVNLHYKLKIDMVGNYSGDQTIQVPAEYFSQEFLEGVRDAGTYDAPKFKIKHMGYADATAGGHTYRHCDKLLIYDIDTKAMSGLRDAFKAAALQTLKAKGVEALRGAKIEDLEILAHVSYGIPVLGAVKLDIKGKYQGMSMKAGLDYSP